MATQSQKSDIVSEIRQVTTQLLETADRIEVLDTSFGALGLDVAGATPLVDGDLVGENGGLTAQQVFDAVYALRLVQQHLDATVGRAPLEKVRTGW